MGSTSKLQNLISARKYVNILYFMLIKLKWKFLSKVLIERPSILLLTETETAEHNLIASIL